MSILLKMIAGAAMEGAGLVPAARVRELEADLAELRAEKDELAGELLKSEGRRRDLEVLLEPPPLSDLARWREANAEDLAHPDPAVSQSEGVLAFRTLLERVTMYHNALNRDRTGLAKGIARIAEIARGYWWVTEGRGSYEWDDKRYQEETGRGIAMIVDLAREALRASGDLATSVLRDGVLPDDGAPPSIGTIVAGLVIDEQRMEEAIGSQWAAIGLAEVFPMLPVWGLLGAAERKAFVRFGQAVLREAVRLAGKRLRADVHAAGAREPGAGRTSP